MGQSQCPACPITAEMNGDAKKDVNHIDCPSCGPYAIEGTFHLRITKGQLSPKEERFVKHDMASFIKEKKPALVGSPDTDTDASEYYSKRNRQRENP